MVIFQILLLNDKRVISKERNAVRASNPRASLTWTDNTSKVGYDCANKIWLLRFVSSACTAGRIKLVYIVFWQWYDLFTVFTIQTRRKGCGFVHCTTSPGSLVALKLTNQNICLICKFWVLMPFDTTESWVKGWVALCVSRRLRSLCISGD